MAFFQRVMHYVFNEVLVNTLANSRTFQRFAIRSNEAMQEFAKKSKTSQAKYNDRVVDFTKTFREEFKKGMDDLQQGQKGPQQGPKR